MWNLLGKAKGLAQGLKHALGLGPALSAEVVDALEEALLLADTGVATTADILADLKKKTPADGHVASALAAMLEERLMPCEKAFELGKARPSVVLMCGVNGSGKTTTLGKLASRWAAEGKRVVVGAADTFRAGAVEQLKVWGERAGVPVVLPAKEGADPAGVAYAAMERALAEKADVVLIDTAGRLTTRKDLMDELGKIVRVLRKLDATAPHHVLLVLDGTLGQSTLPQVRDFTAVAGVTGLVVTKLDSSAKGGFLLALAAQKPPLPVYYVGLGEGVADVEPFDARAFVKGLGLTA